MRFARKPSPPSPKLADQQLLVRLAYQTILGREPDPQGLDAYTQALMQGLTPAALLQNLLASEEHTRKQAPYDHRQDERVMPYLTPEVQALSEQLAHQRPISEASYHQHWQALFEAEQQRMPADQYRYGLDHYKRFYELTNALSLLGAGQGGTLLEFGPSHFTPLYTRLFPALTLHTADRPLPDDYSGFNAARSHAQLGSQAHITLDLNRPLDYPSYRAQLGRYRWVLFTEVLEHLSVSPHELLAFLLDLLTDDGQLYLTTPNYFRHENQQLLTQRRNPQAYYPRARENEDAHHHVREFSLIEILTLASDLGASVQAFHFSACWDPPRSEHWTQDERGNMIFVLSRSS